MGSDHPACGEFGDFVFKMVEPEDHPRILQHLKECFYYDALFRLGYTRDLDHECELAFIDILNDGHNLNFFAEHKITGKVAGCRIITMEKRGVQTVPPFQERITKGIFRFYFEILNDADIPNKYNVDEYPHMFGISVDPEFRQQGLAIEIYKRAKALCKSKGFNVAAVAFISPYSRAAAKHHGYIELSSRKLLEAVDDDGNVLYPEAEPENFLDFGVFELD